METPNDQQRLSDRGNKRTVLVVITILLIANAILLWQFFSKKSENATLAIEKAEVISAKDSITAEYNQVKSELGKLQADNAGLQSKLAENDEQIREQQSKIESLIKANAGIGALKKELAKLRALKDQYESRITELEQQNTQLTAQNQELNTNLSSEKSRNESLSKENQGLSSKVALGSILRADNISISGVRFKSSGKEVEEKKAKNVQKLKVSYSVLENLVVDKGQKNIFIRILGPDKSVMSTSSGTFSLNGQPLPYTLKQEINYDNKKSNQTLYWEKGSAFQKGMYTAEFYTEGSKIGEGQFELR